MGLCAVLPYHECDAKSRNHPDYLACLVHSQVQNIAARFPVFVTGKLSISRRMCSTIGDVMLVGAELKPSGKKNMNPFGRNKWRTPTQGIIRGFNSDQRHKIGKSQDPFDLYF